MCEICHQPLRFDVPINEHVSVRCCGTVGCPRSGLGMHTWTGQSKPWGSPTRWMAAG